MSEGSRPNGSLPRRRLILKLAGVLAMVVACNDESLGPTPAERTVSRAALRSLSDADRPDEAEARALAREIPSFAGLFASPDGVLEVLLTDGGDQSSAVGLVQARMSARAPSRHPVVVRRASRVATYRFADLAAWRNAMAPALHSMAGWTSLDVDESQNRVVVGVERASRVEEALAIAVRTGAPPAAVLVRVEPSARTNSQQLPSRMRPMRGGIGIGPAVGVLDKHNCTLGVIATWGGTPVMLTNSHCTESQWGTDAHSSFMSQPAAPSFVFGPEEYDRQGRHCSLLDTARCRRADVALYSLLGVDLAVGETQAFAVGEIARPVSMQSGISGAFGSLVVDGQNPLRIVGVYEVPIAGHVVHRIGATTGWIYGVVTETCKDRNLAKHKVWGFATRILVCQSTAETNSQPGDSGGPVFVYLGGDEVLFAGLNWGKSEPWDRLGHFSSARQIRSEMFSHGFQFYPSEPPPPSYYVQIQGPGFQQLGTSCTWSAVTNVDAPEFIWYADDIQVGTQQSITLSQSQSFVLRVEAYGATYQGASASLSITVSTQVPVCADQ